MSRTNRCLATLQWTASTFAAAAIFLATTAQAETVTFDIPAQPLASAINEFSKQSGRVVTAPAALLRGKTSPSIKGPMAPDDVLELLLQGTGLNVTTTPDGAQVIQQAGAANYQTGSEGS